MSVRPTDDERPSQGRMMVMQHDAMPLRRELEALREANAVAQAHIGAPAEGEKMANTKTIFFIVYYQNFLFQLNF